MQDAYTDNVSDAVKPGEKVNVRVMSVTDGKVALSMKSKQSADAATGGRAGGSQGVDPEGASAGGRARRQGKVATSAGANTGSEHPGCCQLSAARRRCVCMLQTIFIPADQSAKLAVA